MASVPPARATLTHGDYHPPPKTRVTTLEGAASAILAIYTALETLARRITAINLGTGQHGEKAGDLDARYIRVLTPTTPDEEFEVLHFLDRTPIGYDVCSMDKPAIFYATGTFDRHGWGTRTIKLRCSMSDCAALLRVY